MEKGVPWPSPRFTDNLDGTVLNHLTGVIWLKNATCFGVQTWANSLRAANDLHDAGTPDPTDDCGLRDGSEAGDWRLPNFKELLSLIDLATIIQPSPQVIRSRAC